MDIFLFTCIIGDYILCQEPIDVTFDTDWFAFWLGIVFTALITASAIIVGMVLNNWNDKRVIKKGSPIRNRLLSYCGPFSVCFAESGHL